MPKLTPKQRRDSRVVGQTVDAVFEKVPAGAKKAYSEFLADSIAYLSKHHPDGWGVTLHEHGVRLNAGMVESLVLWEERPLRLLVERKSAPVRAGFDGGSYARAPGCETVAIPLADLPSALRGYRTSHHRALRIAAETMAPRPNIREAHSPGVTKWLSEVLHRPVPEPARPQSRLHIVQGGTQNGDKARLENGDVRWWMVPKTAAEGDELVIHIRGIGFFATARITSLPRPRADWKNRFRANVDSVTLVQPPISLAAIRKHVPDFGWAVYPRSVTTPPPTAERQIRALLDSRRRGDIDLDEKFVESANIQELREIALRAARRKLAPKVGTAIYRTGSAAIRRYVLMRADGVCEGCGAPAPFRGKDDEPYLEGHHTAGKAEGGPDHPDKIIGICPNCHRRAHHAKDQRSFNNSLIRKLRELEAAR